MNLDRECLMGASDIDIMLEEVCRTVFAGWDRRVMGCAGPLEVMVCR